MAGIITVENHGPLILRSNYWTSELAAAGKLFVSVNAGAIRILLPPQIYGDLADMRSATECVLSRGPWPAERQREAVEIMWDDGSPNPYALHLAPASFDLLPAEPDAGREWLLTVWTAKDGKPHKSLERKCHWRRVPRIPWLKPWSAHA
jgi:hypothetical protein